MMLRVFIVALAVLALPLSSEGNELRERVFGLISVPASASMEVRVSSWRGTVRPQFVLVAWQEGERAMARTVVWTHVGVEPDRGSDEHRGWRQQRRFARRMLPPNCGHLVTFDDGLAWCATDIVVDSPRARRLLGLVPSLLTLPAQPDDGRIALDGSGFEAIVRDGARTRRVEWDMRADRDQEPCLVAETVWEIFWGERRGSVTRWRRPLGR